MLIQSAAMSKSAHPGRPYPKNNGVHATQVNIISFSFGKKEGGGDDLGTHRN